MTGLKMTSTTLEVVLAAVKSPPAGGDFVWNGKDQDERPLTEEEMLKGVAAYRKKRGRPAYRPRCAESLPQPRAGLADSNERRS